MDVGPTCISRASSGHPDSELAAHEFDCPGSFFELAWACGVFEDHSPGSEPWAQRGPDPADASGDGLADCDGRAHRRVAVDLRRHPWFVPLECVVASGVGDGDAGLEADDDFAAAPA